VNLDNKAFHDELWNSSIDICSNKIFRFWLIRVTADLLKLNIESHGQLLANIYAIINKFKELGLLETERASTDEATIAEYIKSHNANIYKPPPPSIAGGGTRQLSFLRRVTRFINLSIFGRS
jgi:hypothetical protein